MRRENLMQMLIPHIRFFNSEYRRWGEPTDKDEDLSWLYLDDLTHAPLPVKIPANFLEGIQVVEDNKTWTTQARKDCPGRKVNLEVMDFAPYGNQHKYGELYISGVEFVNGDTCRFGFFMNAMDNRIQPSWKIDIRKIITERDSFAGGDGYELGEGTQRFDDLLELCCTAAYVALLRIEGPFVMYYGDRVCVLGKDKIMLKVGVNGAAYLGPVLKKLLI